MISRRHGTGQRLRQAIGLSCLLLLVLLITGIPVTKPSRKDRSTPFPCMESRCGCMTAEQCWKQCCCHTLEEKLAWARENGITPPQYVLVQCEQKEAESCCCQSHQRETAATDDCKARKSCSSHSSCCEQTEDEEKDSSTLAWLVTLQALKCQGHDGWSLLSQSVPVIQNECTLVFLTCLPSEEVAFIHCELRSHPTAPESPPPKLSL